MPLQVLLLEALEEGVRQMLKEADLVEEPPQRRREAVLAVFTHPFNDFKSVHRQRVVRLGQLHALEVLLPHPLLVLHYLGQQDDHGDEASIHRLLHESE